MPRSKSATTRPTIDSAATRRYGCKRSRALNDEADVFVGDAASLFRGAGERAVLRAAYMQHPDATIVAGATDVGLWITKKLTPLEKIFYVGRIAGLPSIEKVADGYAFGAIVSLGARCAGARLDRS